MTNRVKLPGADEIIAGHRKAKEREVRSKQEQRLRAAHTAQAKRNGDLPLSHAELCAVVVAQELFDGHMNPATAFDYVISWERVMGLEFPADARWFANVDPEISGDLIQRINEHRASVLMESQRRVSPLVMFREALLESRTLDPPRTRDLAADIYRLAIGALNDAVVKAQQSGETTCKVDMELAQFLTERLSRLITGTFDDSLELITKRPPQAPMADRGGSEAAILYVEARRQGLIPTRSSDKPPMDTVIKKFGIKQRQFSAWRAAHRPKAKAFVSLLLEKVRREHEIACRLDYPERGHIDAQAAETNRTEREAILYGPGWVIEAMMVNAAKAYKAKPKRGPKSKT